MKDPELSAEQRQALEYIAGAGGTATPVWLSDRTGWSWQACTRVAGALERKGLVSKRSWPKLTVYEVTADGRAELEVLRVSDRLEAEAKDKGITCGDPDCVDEEHRS
jgi:DNA-binding MarR family transcriptional regulator